MFAHPQLLVIPFVRCEHGLRLERFEPRRERQGSYLGGYHLADSLSWPSDFMDEARCQVLGLRMGVLGWHVDGTRFFFFFNLIYGVDSTHKPLVQ